MEVHVDKIVTGKVYPLFDNNNDLCAHDRVTVS